MRKIYNKPVMVSESALVTSPVAYSVSSDELDFGGCSSDQAEGSDGFMDSNVKRKGWGEWEDWGDLMD